MYSLGKFTKGVSVAIACVLLMATGSPELDTIRVYSNDDGKAPQQIDEVYFGEECPTCRYITIYDENDQLIYDKLVRDVENIQDTKLNNILKKSHFLMKNSITDYYILSK